MSLPLQPRLRRVESFPINQPSGEVVFALRDPQGFAGSIVLSYPAVVLASLMDGSRTLAEIQQAVTERFGQPVALDDLTQLISQLDERFFLDSDRFRAHWKVEVESYLNNPVRPAAHAGAAYQADPQALQRQLDELFTAERGPGAPRGPKIVTAESASADSASADSASADSASADSASADSASADSASADSASADSASADSAAAGSASADSASADSASADSASADSAAADSASADSAAADSASADSAAADSASAASDSADSVTAGELRGVLSPHIDFRRGGSTLAWAYKQILERSAADLFVIFGTAHNPLSQLCSVSRKSFATPLGTVETDRTFISKLAANLASTPGGRELNLFADELAHRQEHSIEFQVVFLQHLLAGRRPFQVVPVLTGSFHEFVASGHSPSESPQLAAFVAAMRKTAADYGQRVCYISGGDLAHIGQRFGDRALLDAARLEQQARDDRQLLAAACQADAEGFFRHIAAQRDCNRICGLSPTYTMLQVMRPRHGELLRYDQAVELDGTSCVSFASLAFYGQQHV